MPQGLQVFAADGSVILDTNDAITRIIGTIEVAAGQSGAVQDAQLISGRGWYYVFTRGAWGIANEPVVTFNPAQGIMSWQYPTQGTQFNAPAFIMYGTY